MERLRQAITTDVNRLYSMQLNLNHPQSTESVHDDDSHIESFDNLDDADKGAERPDPSNRNQVEETEPEEPELLPKRRPLHLPSSHTTPSNHPLQQAELTLRIEQATRYLSALRDAIADKSFQYSHVMRSAPSKGVRTRSRSEILKISDRIAQYSRVYSRARAAMVRLGANEATLNKFKLLSRGDVKASTAILDPNIPGSSTLKLSWIWETGSRLSGSAPEAMRECKPMTYYQRV